MAEGGGQRGPALDQAAAEQLLKTGEKMQWQHVRDYDRQPTVEKFGSKTSHLTIVGLGWAVIVGGSVARSLLDPAKRHLQLSHRLIHARIVAQWCAPAAFVCSVLLSMRALVREGRATDCQVR